MVFGLLVYSDKWAATPSLTHSDLKHILVWSYSEIFLWWKECKNRLKRIRFCSSSNSLGFQANLLHATSHRNTKVEQQKQNVCEKFVSPQHVVMITLIFLFFIYSFQCLICCSVYTCLLPSFYFLQACAFSYFFQLKSLISIIFFP